MAHLNRREFIQKLGRAYAAGLGAATIPGTAIAAEPGVPQTVPTQSDASLPASSDARRPNIIIVWSDQHRWQSLPFTETPELIAPTLTRMGNEGARFDNFISQYPLCSPARSMFMTSRWPSQTGVLDNSTRDTFALDPGEMTIGRAFGAAGYETAFIGKWHLGGAPHSAAPWGFDHSVLWTGTNDHWNSFYFDWRGDRRSSRVYNATHMTDQALTFMKQERDRPYLLLLAWNPPHSNYTDAPAKFNNMYWEPESIPFRQNVGLDREALMLNFGAQYRGYHAHISALDHELSRLFGSLEEAGALDDTLIIYTSDHGDQLGSHNHIGKRVPYSESIKIPFLARWPGRVNAGAQSNAPVGIIDLLPTLCGLADVPTPAGSEGLDHSGLLTGEGGHAPKSQLIMNVSNVHPPASNPFPSDLYRGVVTERYTYAVRLDGPWLLFDNENDPFQQRNLISDSDTEATRMRLHAVLTHWLQKSGDSFPIQSPTLAATM